MTNYRCKFRGRLHDATGSYRDRDIIVPAEDQVTARLHVGHYYEVDGPIDVKPERAVVHVRVALLPGGAARVSDSNGALSAAEYGPVEVTAGDHEVDVESRRHFYSHVYEVDTEVHRTMVAEGGSGSVWSE